jgi:hypothetical protein
MSCIQVIPTNFTFVKIRSRRNYGEFHSISKFEPAWIIWENIKPHGPTHQPHGPNNGAAVPTAFGPRAPPCPPMASPAAPACRPTHRFRRPRPPPRAAFKRSAPPRELPFFLLRRCRHCAVTAPSSTPTSGAPLTSLPAPSAAPLLHHRHSSPVEPSDRGQPTPAILQPSRPHPKHRATEYIHPDRSDPTSDPYSGLPPSLPHRRSPLPQRSLLVSSSPLFDRQTGLSPRRLTPQPLHRRSPAGQISLATHWC